MTALKRVPISKNHSRLGYKIRYAIAHPDRILPYARRRARNVRIGVRGGGHIPYYRAIMRSNIRRGPNAAVGSRTPESWLRVGQMQFDYLLGHGLGPAMKVLDIGCGNLRAGRLFVDYLETGHYYGVDISPEILLAAAETITQFGLQAKLPHLTLVQNLQLAFLPSEAFDVVNAHSVFTHSPLDVIDECLRNVGRVMTPVGFFDFTFNRTDGSEHQVLHEDFYYRTETLIDMAAGHGLRARLMDDWGTVHSQSKLRVTR